VVPVALWATAAPLSGRFADLTTALASLSVISAVTGVTAFALNLVLGARLGFVQSSFGGLDNLYLVHRATGRIAFLLLVGHALLMAASRATVSVSGALALFTPASGWTIFLGVIALAAMTVAIVLTLYVRLGHEVFVYVQRAFGFIFLVATLHVFMTPGAKAASPALKWYLAVVSAVGIAAWAYRSLFGNLLVRRHSYLVTAVEELDPSVVEIAMRPTNGALRFIPGQFVFVTFYSSEFNSQFHPFSVGSEGESGIVSLRPGDVSSQFHPFSITSTPDDAELRVVVKAVGDYTTALHRLDRGASARIEGPYGRFSYVNARSKRQVWIAGGIGITPFLSMARSITSEAYDIELYYCFKTRDQAYFLEELCRLAEQEPRLVVRPFPEDQLGFITAGVVEEGSGDLTDRDILLCGPPGMIESLRAQFQDRGVSAERIHSEEFGFGGR
jgi:predicted ferric reductase